MHFRASSVPAATNASVGQASRHAVQVPQWFECVAVRPAGKSRLVRRPGEEEETAAVLVHEASCSCRTSPGRPAGRSLAPGAGPSRLTPREIRWPGSWFFQEGSEGVQSSPRSTLMVVRPAARRPRRGRVRRVELRAAVARNRSASITTVRTESKIDAGDRRASRRLWQVIHFAVRSPSSNQAENRSEPVGLAGRGDAEKRKAEAVRPRLFNRSFNSVGRH